MVVRVPMTSQRADIDGNSSGRPPRNGNGQPPWVNVHVLSETIFCRRAGLLAYELREDDDGQERDLDRPPRLDWLPTMTKRRFTKLFGSGGTTSGECPPIA